MTTLTLTRPAGMTYEEAVAEGRRAKKARRFLLPFCQWVNPRYESAAHLEVLASELEAVERGDVDRLMVLMPPRHGKSETASRRFPAWYLGRHPDRRIIIGSYAAGLAHKLGRAVRNTMKMQRYQEIFPETRLSDDSTAKNDFDTTKDGGLLAVGVGGGVTGHGGNVVLIDDPVKNREQAESETYRENAWDWYKGDLYTRLEPDGAIVLVQTPWHADDLHGRILDEEGDIEEGGEWRVVRLAAMAEEDDPLGRERGAALWPTRFGIEALNRIKLRIGSREWSALYQQRPSPAEGHIFKWWNRYDEQSALVKPDYILLPIDTAYTAAETSDYTAWSAWAARENHLDLVAADRCREEPPIAEARIAKTYRDLVAKYPDVPIVPLVKQRVAIDRVAASHLRARGIPVTPIEIPAGNTIEAMANIIVHFFESGIARVPKPCAWLDPWMEQHINFPTAKHDDWVENTIVALMKYRAGTQADDWTYEVQGAPFTSRRKR